MKDKTLKVLSIIAIVLSFASLVKIFIDMNNDDIKDIAGEYQSSTWWHLSIDSKEKYLSIYDNEAGNPGVEGKIDFIDGSSLIVKIDPDYYEELPSAKWESDGETLEVKYMKTNEGIELENNGKTLSFIREEE